MNWTTIISVLITSGVIGVILSYLAAPATERLAFRGKARQDAISILQTQLSEQKLLIDSLTKKLEGVSETLTRIEKERSEERHSLNNKLNSYVLKIGVAKDIFEDVVKEVHDLPAFIVKDIEKWNEPIKI